MKCARCKKKSAQRQWWMIVNVSTGMLQRMIYFCTLKCQKATIDAVNATLDSQ
jgi:hypothetical protein